MKKFFLMLLFVFLLLPIAIAHADANGLIPIDNNTTSYTFCPGVNGEYGIYYYPGSGSEYAKLCLYQGAQLLLYGEGTQRVMTMRLNATSEYTITIEGASDGYLEIARETLSRCFSSPLTLSGNGDYTKRIARSGDFHWYRLTPEISGAALISVSGGSLPLQLMLFDQQGKLLRTGEQLPGGTALLDTTIRANVPLLLRVSAQDPSTGNYTISSRTSTLANAPDTIVPENEDICLSGRTQEPLTYSLSPFGSCPLIYVETTAPEIADVSDGTVISGLPGSCEIRLYAWGGARATCRITVTEVSVTGIALESGTLLICKGDTVSCNAKVIPENASNPSFMCISSDETILLADADGFLTGIDEGEALLTVASVDGSYTATRRVLVEPAKPRYRALLINETDYATELYTKRVGSTESIKLIQDTLTELSFGGIGYELTTLSDPSRDSIVTAIRSAFGASESIDTSLIYITCHGFYTAGMTQLLCVDGSVLSAAELSEELRKLPGTVIVLLDLCTGGGMIGAASDIDDITSGATSSFTEALGPAELNGGNLYVIASALADQDSYRIGTTDDDMLTAFARAFYDATQGEPRNADLNADGRISFTELIRYTRHHVRRSVQLAQQPEQTVCASPENSDRSIFEWSSAE